MSGGAKTRLPQLELDCLRVIWKKPGVSVAEVRAALGRPLAYTTVMTVLERMSAKGVVERRKSGRAYLYSPLLDEDSARREAVARLLVNLFENDREELISYLGRFRSREAAPAARAVSRPAAKRPRGFVPSHIDESLL